MKFVGRKLVLLAMAALIWPWPVAADNHIGTGTSQSLQIAPPIVELTVDPGQSLAFDVRVGNISGNDLTVRNQVNDFVAGGEGGEPKLLLDEDETSPYSVKGWIQPVAQFQLVPREIRTVSFRMNVPVNASPGGHYGVVRFTGTPPELEGSGVSLSGSIGSLIFVNVRGAAREEVDLAFLGASQGRRGTDKIACEDKSRSLFEYGPLCFTQRIQNKGTVHVKPTGKLIIRNIFGRKVAELGVNNDPARNILPNSTRKFEQTSNKRFWLGRYQASAELSYGNNKQLVKSMTFWVIPWKLVLLVLIFMVTMLYLLHKSVLRYNERIIRQSQRHR